MKKLSTRILALLAFALCAVAPVGATVTCQSSTGVGDALKLPVYEWSDPTIQPKGVIFAMHGATLYARRFDTAANQLVSEGYKVYGLDFRGYGRWREEGESFSDGTRKIEYDKTKSDIISLLKKIRESNPNVPIYCLGESLGANLAVWVASEHPDLTDGIIAVSPCIKTCVHPNPIFVVGFFKGIVDVNRSLKITPFMKPYLSDDKEATLEYITDPKICHSMTAKDVLKVLFTNARALANTANMPASMPVLLVAGQLDKVYNASAVPRFAESLGSKHSTVEIIPRRGHLLVESPRLEPKVLTKIESWLQSQEQIANAKSAPTTTASAVIEPATTGNAVLAPRVVATN